MNILQRHIIERSTYGIIVYVALILGLYGTITSPAAMMISIIGSLAVIAFAEAYASVISQKFNGTKPSKELIMQEVRSTMYVLIGSEGPILFLLMAAINIISLQTAVIISVGVATALLFIYSYLGSRALKRDRVKSLGIASISLVAVALLVSLKVFLK